MYDAELSANRANWDERVAAHVEAYHAAQFAADPAAVSLVVRQDAAALAPHLPGGTVRGLTLAHLMCHIGTDSISWQRLGAQVTAVDFSPAAIAAARELAARAGVGSRFECCELTDAPGVIGTGFDVVYTSIGVLCWLPDLEAWARTIATLLRPGGLFFLRDSHPVLGTLDDGRTDNQLTVVHPYFPGGPRRIDDGEDYTGADIEHAHQETYVWQHSVQEIVMALLGAGLELVDLSEGDTLPWAPLPGMVRTADGWALPDAGPQLPLSLTVIARAPAGGFLQVQ